MTEPGPDTFLGHHFWKHIYPCHSGVSFLVDSQKSCFSSWFPFETTTQGVPAKTNTDSYRPIWHNLTNLGHCLSQEPNLNFEPILMSGAPNRSPKQNRIALAPGGTEGSGSLILSDQRPPGGSSKSPQCPWHIPCLVDSKAP